MSTAALCLLAGALHVALPAARFTLAWTHTIEKTAWEEDYAVEPAGLRLLAARVSGSGAGMEPPAGAVLRDGRWHHVPAAPQWLPQLTLANSAFGADYVLCIDGQCRPLSAFIDGARDAVTLVPCTA